MKFQQIAIGILSGLLAVGCAAGKYEKTPRGVVVNVASAAPDGAKKVRLEVVGDKIIRVSATPDSKFAPDASLVTVEQETRPEFAVTETDSTVSVVTSQVCATVDLATGDVKFYNKEGRLIAAEAPGGRKFSPIEVEGTKGYTVSQRFESLSDRKSVV